MHFWLVITNDLTRIFRSDVRSEFHELQGKYMYMAVYLASAKCSIHSKLQRKNYACAHMAPAHDLLWSHFLQDTMEFHLQNAPESAGYNHAQESIYIIIYTMLLWKRHKDIPPAGVRRFIFP